MPLAGDAYLQQGGQLPAGNNPLNRLQLGSFTTTIDPAQIIAQWTQFVEDYLFPIIEDLTGVDLSAFLPILDGTVGALTTLFGDLNPLSGTFDPLDAVTTFIELMVEVGANLPMALISELAGFSGGVPILSQLIGLFTGTTGGLTGLSGLGSIFGDLTGLLGNPTALGSGTPVLGSAGSIPLLGPLIEEFVSLLGGVGAGTGLGGLTTIFDDLLGVLGNPTGLGSGTPGIGSLGSIPLLGPVFGLFGAADAAQAGNFFTNLLSFLGTPTLTGSTGTFDPTTVATSFINDILNPTGLLTSVTAIVEALTGSSGDLTDLTAWATDIPILGDIVAAITGSTGGLTDLTSFFTDFLGVFGGATGVGGVDSFITDLLGIFGNPTGLGTGSPTIPGVGSIPILGPLFGLFGGASDSTQAGNFFTSIISLFGNPTGMTSGSPTVPALGSIPILGPVFGLFNGASNATQANNFVTSIMSLFGNPAGTLTGSPTVPALGSIPILGPVFGLFGGATTATGATNWVTDLLGVLGTPTSMGSGTPVVDTIGRIPIFGGLLDQLFGGLTGSTTSGATQTVVGAAAASTTDTVAGQGALIEQIKAALGVGTPDSDDFERATLGSAWTFVASSGTGAIPDSHNFHYSGNTTAAEYVMRKNDVVSATDHITSTIILNQAIPTYFFLPLPYGGNIDVWVRQTAFTTYATRTGVRLRINSNGATASYALDWVSSGTATSLATGSCSIPAAGAAISLEAGAGGNSRRFLGTINGSPIVDFTDTGLVTTIGVSNRYRGFGGRGTNGVGTNQGTPDIRQWTAQG